MAIKYIEVNEGEINSDVNETRYIMKGGNKNRNYWSIDKHTGDIFYTPNDEHQYLVCIGPESHNFFAMMEVLQNQILLDNLKRPPVPGFDDEIPF